MTFAFSFTQAASIAPAATAATSVVPAFVHAAAIALAATPAASVPFSATQQAAVAVVDAGAVVSVTVPPLIAPPSFYSLLTEAGERLLTQGGDTLSQERA
jgi:hypothetical protein